MIRRFAQCALIVFAFSGAFLQLRADVYELSNGEKIEGDPISFDARGVVFKKTDQSFAPRVSWTNFTDAALKRLSEFPEGKKFAEELMVDEEIPQEEAAAQLEIKPQPVPRLDRLPPSAGLLGMARSPLGLALLILVYLANIYAGFEVAVFRNYPVWVVCLMAALFPLVGPIIFLCLPTRVHSHAHPAYETPVEHLQPEEAHAAYAEAQVHAAAAPAAAPPQEKSAAPAATVYQRGTTTFNRRFFETKLANFMRVVPSEQDKDLVLVVKSARGEHIGSRISRVTPSDLCLQVNKGGASAEVSLPFTEIKEVQVCHKDAVEKT
jgi:hypothetical protein